MIQYAVLISIIGAHGRSPAIRHRTDIPCIRFGTGGVVQMRRGTPIWPCIRPRITLNYCLAARIGSILCYLGALARQSRFSCVCNQTTDTLWRYAKSVNRSETDVGRVTVIACQLSANSQTIIEPVLSSDTQYRHRAALIQLYHIRRFSQCREAKPSIGTKSFSSRTTLHPTPSVNQCTDACGREFNLRIGA